MLVNCTHQFTNRLIHNATRSFGARHYSRKNDLFNVSSQVATSQPMSVPFFKEHENEFMGYLPAVLKSLLENKDNSDLAPTTERLSKLLEYNLPIGDKVKGVTTVVSYKMLEISKNLTEENVKLANILGWCAELLDAANMVAEDIINNSETRRNAPCWFRLPLVGHGAYMDPFIMETCIFNLLNKYFSKHVHYTAMINFFHTAFNKNAAGRILDYQKRNIDELNMDTFHRITRYKYGYDAFYVGFTLGMFISRIYDNALHRRVTPILMDLGRYFQIQKDVQDCLSDATITGNVGTSIAEGRCNWLVIKALEKSNPRQRQIIENNYGRKEEEAVQAILNLYKSLDIAAEFRTYEEDSYNTLCINIDEIANIRICKLLSLIVNQLYNR